MLASPTAIVFLTGGLLLGGCGTARYVPKRPAGQTTPVGRITPLHLDRTATGDSELALETDLRDGARLHGAHAGASCGERAIERVAVDDEPIDAARPVDLSGARSVTLVHHDVGRDVLLDVEWSGPGGQRQCVPVSVDWPDGWARDAAWEYLVSFGADFNLAGDPERAGVGGVRVELWRWFDEQRLGIQAGLVSDFCDPESCDGREAALFVPLGVESVWSFFRSTSTTLGAVAFIDGGLRATFYWPLPETEPRGEAMLSPQAALRLGCSFPPAGPGARPAGITLDHGIYFGPTLVPDTGQIAPFFGFSIGMGWTD